MIYEADLKYAYYIWGHPGRNRSHENPKISFISMLNDYVWMQAEESQYTEIEKDINELKWIGDKKHYLENVLDDDQAVRGSEGQGVMLKYGKDSKEFMDYVSAQRAMDELNLLKVEKYLEIHGYPKKELGEKATSAPWMVIHHSQAYDARVRNFENVYKAYLNGDIDDVAISFYLGRMYEMKNGKRLTMESPYTGADEINQLIVELDLFKEKANAEERVHRFIGPMGLHSL